MTVSLVMRVAMVTLFHNLKFPWKPGLINETRPQLQKNALKFHCLIHLTILFYEQHDW